MTGGWLLLVTSMAAVVTMQGFVHLGRMPSQVHGCPLQLPSRSRSQPACERLFVYLFMYIRPATARSLALLLLK